MDQKVAHIYRQFGAPADEEEADQAEEEPRQVHFTDRKPSAGGMEQRVSSLEATMKSVQAEQVEIKNAMVTKEEHSKSLDDAVSKMTAVFEKSFAGVQTTLRDTVKQDLEADGGGRGGGGGT